MQMQALLHEECEKNEEENEEEEREHCMQSLSQKQQLAEQTELERNLVSTTRKPGRWHLLPPEVCDRIWSWIGDVDMCGYVSMVSKQHVFRPSELVFQRLCETIYVSQTSKGLLRIEKWNSWKRMLVFRPRLRTNGFYCLKTIYSRAPNNDKFWEKKRTQSVETTYYRYLRFFNNGQVLYALNTIHPYDMARSLKHCTTDDKKIYLGHYTLTGRQLQVDVQLHYCVMGFTLSIQDVDDGWVGKHNMLTLEAHSCSSLQSNTPGATDQRVLFHNPSEASQSKFYFWRQWYWS